MDATFMLLAFFFLGFGLQNLSKVDFISYVNMMIYRGNA